MGGIIKRWSFDVGSMLAQQLLTQARVFRRCGRCDTWEPVNLAKLVEAKNPLFSLHGRHPPCEKCGTKQTFHISHAPGAVVLPMSDPPEDPQVQLLHKAWKRHEAFLRFPYGDRDLNPDKKKG